LGLGGERPQGHRCPDRAQARVCFHTRPRALLGSLPNSNPWAGRPPSRFLKRVEQHVPATFDSVGPPHKIAPRADARATVAALCQSSFGDQPNDSNSSKLRTGKILPASPSL